MTLLPPGISWRNWRIDMVWMGVLAAITFATHLLEITPVIQRRQAYATQTQDLDVDKRKLNEQSLLLRTMTQQLELAQKTLEKEKRQLNPVDSLNEHLGLLSEVAIQDGLKVDGVEPGKTTPGPRYYTVNIRLVGRGTYKDCARFLRNLHQKMPDMSVVALDLNEAPGPGGSGGFQFELIWYTALPKGGADK